MASRFQSRAGRPVARMVASRAVRDVVPLIEGPGRAPGVCPCTNTSAWSAGSASRSSRSSPTAPVRVHSEHRGSRCDGAVRKLLAAPAIQFKGTGWYVTDYGRAGKKPPAESSARTDGSRASRTASPRPSVRRSREAIPPRAPPPRSFPATSPSSAGQGECLQRIGESVT